VKEGRKYDLGAVLVTQQPGSIPSELLSQGDNFFVFHLLSAGDLTALKKANAHFSDDLLAALLNEPLVGHGIFWSSAPGTDRHARPYPVSIRALNFEDTYHPQDPSLTEQPLNNYATRLRAQFQQALAKAASAASDGAPVTVQATDPGPSEPTDVQQTYRAAAIKGLRGTQDVMNKLHSTDGVAWWRVQRALADAAPDPEVIGDPFQWAYRVVVEAVNEILGPQNQAWRTERRPHPTRKSETWIIRIP
jgi:uncharacterized protein